MLYPVDEDAEFHLQQMSFSRRNHQRNKCDFSILFLKTNFFHDNINSSDIFPFFFFAFSFLCDVTAHNAVHINRGKFKCTVPRCKYDPLISRFKRGVSNYFYHRLFYYRRYTYSIIEEGTAILEKLFKKP